MLRSILNVLSVVLVLVVNYYSQTGEINGKTVGELSDQYDNLFTPAGYAFSIWGIIFLGLIFYSGHQLLRTFLGKDELKEHAQTGFWFAWVNLANASWVVAWLYEYTALSVLIMIFMLSGLITIIIRTNVRRYDAPVMNILLIWWPVCIYAGWISVATIANISAYLSKINWTGWGISETVWTLVMIAAATLINMLVIWTRNLREFAAVAVWAFMAIYVRHQFSEEIIATTALFAALLLTVVIVLHYMRSIHRNRV